MSLLPASVQPLFSAAAIAATKAKTSSAGSSVFIFILLAFMAVYFLWLRPQRNRLRMQQVQHRDAEVGDEVVTTAGIVGRVLSSEGDRMVIETGHGHTMTVLRSAIARKVEPESPDFPPTDDEQGPGTAFPGASEGTVDDLDAPPQGDRRWWPGGNGPSESEGGPS